MNTLYLSSEDATTPKLASDIIKTGGLVALPTETVYGLGANGLDDQLADASNNAGSDAAAGA